MTGRSAEGTVWVVVFGEGPRTLLRAADQDGVFLRSCDDLSALVSRVRSTPVGERARLLLAARRAEDLPPSKLRALEVPGRRLEVVVALEDFDAAARHEYLLAGAITVVDLLRQPIAPLAWFRSSDHLDLLLPDALDCARHERHELRVPSDRKHLVGLVRLICDRCDRFGHPLDFVRSQLPLVVDEIVTNAMKHGNAWDASLEVRVEAEIDAGGLVLRVTDQGEGFARDEVRDPLAEENRTREGGRGLFLIEALMDRVEYFDGGRGIEVERRFRHHADAPLEPIG